MEGYIKLPEGAKVVHVGATPPRGELSVFAEIADVDMPEQRREIVILKAGDSIPDSYKFMGVILSQPTLLVYERETKILLSA